MAPSMATTVSDRRQQINARHRELDEMERNIAPVGQIATPTVSIKGPDLNVQAGRMLRSVTRQAIVDRVPGATTRMSEADIRKLDRSNRVTAPGQRSFEPETPGLDAFARQNTKAHIVAREARAAGLQVGRDGNAYRVTPDGSASGRWDRVTTASQQHDNFMAQTPDAYRSSMQQRIAAAAGDYQAQKARSAAAPPAGVSPAARVQSIAPTLRRGDYVGITQGNETAAGRMSSDGTYETGSFRSAPGTKISTRPGRVKNERGEWVPIREETQRIATPFDLARDRAQKNSEYSASVFQRDFDGNPKVQMQRTMAAIERQRATSSAAPAPAPVYDPYRRPAVNRSATPGRVAYR